MKQASILFFRLKAMIGSVSLLLFLLLTLFFCFHIAHTITTAAGAETLRLAVVDLDESRLSASLTDDLRALAGVTLSVSDESSAQLMLARGNVEGILTIGAGYAAALTDGTRLPLFYDSAQNATSRTAARELIAGRVIAQRILLRAAGELEDLGIPATEAELRALIAEFEENAHPLYAFSYHTTPPAGVQSTQEDRMSTSYLGFVALVLILVLLSLSQWFAQPDTRRVATRMGVIPQGAARSFWGDVGLLFGIGSVILLLAYLASRSLSLRELLFLFAYLYCLVGICLALSKLQEAGSMDVMAPLLALFTSILGGVFLDLGALSPGLRILSLLTPQGQMLYGLASGALWPLVVLAGVGTGLLGVCFPWRNERRGV
ncbi:MAG: ABC transporter permease [Oscillospiraceae bacterium]|nr:ABC transporter permease [Oscillospiraceae bacterium]